MESDPVELAELAAQARRYFRWVVLLLLVAMGILVIDLQLKRSVARQYAEAAGLLGRAVASGRQAPDVAAASDDSSLSGSSRGDAVDGSTPMAEGTDPPAGPKPPRNGRVAKRPGSDAP